MVSSCLIVFILFVSVQDIMYFLLYSHSRSMWTTAQNFWALGCICRWYSNRKICVDTVCTFNFHFVFGLKGTQYLAFQMEDPLFDDELKCSAETNLGVGQTFRFLWLSLSLIFSSGEWDESAVVARGGYTFLQVFTNDVTVTDGRTSCIRNLTRI